jgi:hypothetical protein
MIRATSVSKHFHLKRYTDRCKHGVSSSEAKCMLRFHKPLSVVTVQMISCDDWKGIAKKKQFKVVLIFRSDWLHL